MMRRAVVESSRHLKELHVLKLVGVPIFDQLVLEEALLRTDQRNWFIWNVDTPSDGTIVLGLSSKPHLLLDVAKVKADNIPLIRRFTGGGTVIVDHDTVFSSFIMNHKSLPEVPAFPQQVMTWTGSVYKPVFDAHTLASQLPTCSNHDDAMHLQGEESSPKSQSQSSSSQKSSVESFALKQDDYVFGNYKVGGNAQSITRDRWCHHTSFFMAVSAVQHALFNTAE